MHRNPMREARNQLILLGFICQGYSFGNFVMPVLYALVWVACMKFHRPDRSVSLSTEYVVVTLAIFLAFIFGGDYGYNRLVFIGNALVVFQALRMIRPLNLREKTYSIAVALIHLGVGTQVIVDYEFLLVLLAALYLVPKSLFELEAEQYRRIAGGRHATFTRRSFAFLALAMVAFFVLFPRFRVLSNAGRFGQGGPRQEEQDEVDPSSGGSELSEYLIFRIEGRGLDYIKESGFDQWDGQTWKQSHWMNLADRYAYGRDTDGALHRSVRVLNHRFLGSSIPVDGYVLRVSGPFSQRLYVAEHGGVMTPFEMNRNVTYEYWTSHEQGLGELPERDRRRYLRLPPPSPELEDWLANQVGNVQDPERIASRLVQYFQENHEYRLGAPDLDRLAPVDDFVLNQQPGHCERFASALAVVLRMRGIPSRVAVGWLATERNDIGGFYNVRARHGHAWTEAWLDGKGWVTFDATPYGQGLAMEDRSLGLTIFEWVEYVWYAKIVEFGVGEQDSMLGFVGETIKVGISGLIHNIVSVLLLVCAVVLGYLFYRQKWWRFPLLPRRRGRRHAMAEARHFYGRMLRLLRKRKIYRRPSQTPLEFLAELEEQQVPQLADVRDLTRWFCDVRYGRRQMTDELKNEVQVRLKRLAKG